MRTDSWPTGLSFLAGVELPGHEFPVPAEDGVWRNDGGQLEQDLATNGLSFHRQEPTLVVGEQESWCLFAEPTDVRDVCGVVYIHPV